MVCNCTPRPEIRWLKWKEKLLISFTDSFIQPTAQLIMSYCRVRLIEWQRRLIEKTRESYYKTDIFFKFVFDKLMVHFYTPLLVFEPLLPAGLEGLQNDFHLSLARAIALTPFHKISPFLQSLLYPFFRSLSGIFFWYVPLCHFRVLSSHILTRSLNHHLLFVFSGTAAQREICPPRSRGFVITHNDAPQSVGLLWTSDQPVAKTSTWQNTIHTTDKHPCPRWDSNHDHSRRGAIYLRLWPRGHCDRRLNHYKHASYF
jgi:hypothetical protein